MPPSIAVIGAGVAGLSTAWHLIERGVEEVTVLEAGHPAIGSSGLSAGIIQTQHLTRQNIELRAIARQFYNRLETEYGLEITRNGYIRLGFSYEQLAAFETSVAIQREYGIEDSRVVTTNELRELVPDLQVDDAVAGLYGPSDGFLDGHLLCSLLSDLVRARGATFRLRTTLTAAEQTSNGRYRLHTSSGAVEADVVVNAAGAWAPRVAEMLSTVAPLRTERHQAVVVTLPKALPYVMPCVQTYAPGSGVTGLYFRHERAGQLIAGLHSLDPIGEVVDPDNHARGIDLDFAEELAERLTERLPTLEGAELAGGWAGIYPMSVDGLPQVGPAPGHTAIISVCGGGGSGIALAPAMGRLASEWIVDGTPSCVSDGDALAPDRLVGRTETVEHE